MTQAHTNWAADDWRATCANVCQPRLGPLRIVCLTEEPTEWLYMLGEERRNPDLIFGSWCGRRFRAAHMRARPGWQKINAVKNDQLFETKSAEILQPGPACLTDGIEQIHKIITDWGDLYASA